MGLSRGQAARALARVIGGGRSLDEALPGSAEPGTRALVYETLRLGHRLDFMLGKLLRKPIKPDDADLHALLLAGLCELTRFSAPDYAVVDGVVEATRKLDKPWAAKLANAVLRNFLRGRDGLEAEAGRDPAASVSHPAWLAKAIRADWPDEAGAIFAANNDKGPMWLRVNTRRVSVDDYRTRLAEAGIAVAAAGPVPEALMLQRPVEVAELPGFAQGQVSVQDAAAQLAAHLLDLQPGFRVLDACCAPGGKTGHILEHVPEGTRLTAVEKDAGRLDRVRENLQRLGLDTELVAGDAARPDAWWDGEPFDRILLDAPCSGTGVIRRHPDIKWLRRASDIAAHAELQSRLLAALWPLLAPGGHLLYATCSILEAENAGRIEVLLAERTDAGAVPLPEILGTARGAGRQVLPGEGGMDGFFYALLAKNA